MDFFEQVGKKLSDAGRGIARQTRNLSDLTALHGRIAEKEKKLQQLYIAIGKAYYEEHAEDASCPYEEVAEIGVLKREIDQCYEEQRRIKGGVTCPACGSEVAKDSMFCNNCGAKIEKASAAVQSNVRVCPKCGAEVCEDNLFCNVCGNKMDE